jgi:hypothetical protein
MTLIEKLLDGGKKAIDAAKRPFTIAKLSRSFQSAIDSPKERIVDEEIKIQNLRLKLVEDTENSEKYINDIIRCREEIRKAERTVEIVTAEQKLMFEEDIKEDTDTAG